MRVLRKLVNESSETHEKLKKEKAEVFTHSQLIVIMFSWFLSIQCEVKKKKEAEEKTKRAVSLQHDILCHVIWRLMGSHLTERGKETERGIHIII